MSTTHFYESSSGDRWDLVRDDADGAMHVKHTPNLASGGQSSTMTVDDFLRIEPHSPQHQALAALLTTGAGKPPIRGYVHDPKETGGPYIAVVLRDNDDPVVTLHKSYAEAEAELSDKLARLRQTTLAHQQ